ncbi:uncharacterized protein [Branchiostoma lanceolatum]|uniref:uncharacterized protein n=1 Tax=Branchiostoma lanceolatum TaxID=7740 RepID=UPI00345541B5
MMDKNISAIEDYATEAVSIFDKAYKMINFRVLLVGVKVLTERWPGEDPKPSYANYLKPKVREYIWNTIRPQATFHTAVYVAGPPHWDAGYAGAGICHLCKVNGMNDFPFVMAAEDSKRPADHYWNAHEIGHEFRNGHNFDPSDGGSSICPAKRLFGTKCVMGGNSYPTTFSSTFLDKIRATDYSCMADKPPQVQSHSIFATISDTSQRLFMIFIANVTFTVYWTKVNNVELSRLHYPSLFMYL